MLKTFMCTFLSVCECILGILGTMAMTALMGADLATLLWESSESHDFNLSCIDFLTL